MGLQAFSLTGMGLARIIPAARARIQKSSTGPGGRSMKFLKEGVLPKISAGDR